MSESCLSQKISLCRCIETLNDDECLQVIRLLQHYQKYEHLNQLLVQIIMKITSKMNVESLEHIYNEIKQISCNNKYLQTQTHCADNKSKKSEKCASIDHEHVIFPLFRLPVDIIKNTSLFLNEKEIISFEKCCRLFYQMINNLSYLKQSNNFKTFTIDTLERLDQMIESKYSFYKYSQSHTMKVTINHLGNVDLETNGTETTFINKTQSKWEKAKCIDKYNGYWLTNLFKSIKSLNLLEDPTMALLDKLPLKILFDPQSKFERFTISHYWNETGSGNFGHLQRAIDEFEREYLELKEKYQQQGKKIKKLKCLTYSSDGDSQITGPRYIEAEHLIMHSIKDSCPVQDLFSTIRVLTCSNYLNANTTKLNTINCNIDTLRLINVFPYRDSDICMNEKMIQALNLHQNLVNLTLHIDMALTNENNIARWIKAIETILCKQYYHHLKNVNILIEILDRNVDCAFQMLQKNVLILKHQFNQLNIGLKIVSPGWLKYCTIEWNSQIDENYLNRTKQEMNGKKIKYDAWLNMNQ